MTLWMQTSGSWINVGSVLLGTALGVALRSGLSEAAQRTLRHAVGLMTLVLGVQLALGLSSVRVGIFDGAILALLSLALGGVLGEGLGLEQRLAALSQRVVGTQATTSDAQETRAAQGVLTAFLLFCIGPLTLLGSLRNGLSGDHELLLLKATLDGLAAITLTCSFGWSVGLSVVPLLLFQGSLSLAAGALSSLVPDPSSDLRVLLVSGIGGVLIVALGLGLLDLVRVRVAALLPALLVGPLLIEAIGALGT
jgi:uncharacterized protein